jgi:hypothetical protein
MKSVSLSLMLLVCFISTYGQDSTRNFRKYRNQEFNNFLVNEQLATKNWELDPFYVDDNANVRIKIMFHIFNTNDISQTDVQQQIDILNRAFFEKPVPKPEDNNDEKYYKSLAKSTGFTFELYSEGIKYYQTNLENATDLLAPFTPTKGGVSPINPDKVINIYVCSQPKDAVRVDVAGYASGPNAPREYDGIVISPDFFSKGKFKNYDEGKSLIHLMGIYLGLKELWNENQVCANDGVADTPRHHAPTYEIIREENKRYITACDGWPDGLMYMNYMDNTDDKHLEMFTEGQVRLMKYVVSSMGPRALLNHSNNIPCNEEFTGSRCVKLNVRILHLGL